MRLSAVLAIAEGWAVVSCVFGLIGCLNVSQGDQGPSMVAPPQAIQDALLDKTQQEVSGCAAVSPRVIRQHPTVLLEFYKEASILEEDFAVTKSSFPRIHHGCRAFVELRDGRIDAIGYQSVPAAYPHYLHCDEIFAPCLGR